MAYDSTDHARALEVYELTGRNMARTSRDTDISKPTLNKWRREGLPVEVTGGLHWDDYLDDKESAQVQEMRLSVVEEEREFIDAQRERTRQMLDKIYTAVMAGGAEIKPSDYSKILRDYMLLQNMDQEKSDFMQAFASRMIGIVAEILMQLDGGEPAFALFRSRVEQLMSRERESLDLLPSGVQ